MRSDLKTLHRPVEVGCRCVDSKYPPIELFDDVASQEDFEVLYALQALTNPRIQAEVGNLSFLQVKDMPLGITGCSYACAPFTHVSPEGSRFSDGTFGLLYIASDTATALKEVAYHREKYCSNVHGLKFERFVYRKLKCEFSIESGLDATGISMNDPLYHEDDYSEGRGVGTALKIQGKVDALCYNSVRNTGAICWALFTPILVRSIIQANHYEMIWDETRLGDPMEIKPTKY